jgi:hypothetical protein
MTLSEDEIRAIAKLRRRQQQLLRWRVPGAIFSASQIILWLFIINYSFSLPINDPSAKLMLLVYIIPTAYAFIGIASVVLADTIWNWRGKAETDLLLRVIEEIQNTKT